MESRLCGAGDPGLTLFETMYWDGHSVPRWPLHRARLARGAAALGWRLPEVTPAGPLEPARLRLTLDLTGQVDLQAGPLPPARDLWRLGLSSERLHSDDPWLRVKSSRRAPYDRARAAMPRGLHEVLLLNERGEVCEGSITTLFFDRGRGMRTPPLSCGLLPGILRAEMDVPEEVLLPEDLPRVSLWVGNALRGLCRAVWVG
ncbi:aminotransferase class IV [Pararhodobacter marinus]|uniref:aminotransferase class IV n=1 Tax=Pararhodobacter marinus TaxID=2184063 RepID=UPI0035161827